MKSPMSRHWTLDPEVTFLNHGSFGACPRKVLEVQSEWRARMERQPVKFFVGDLWDALTAARERLAAFVDADAEGLAFVRNATEGANAVLRSLRLGPGDELLTTDHAYPAFRNALEYVAGRSGARIAVAPIPFPGTTADAVVDAVLSRVTEHTRLVLLDHVTSPTGLVLPVQRLVDALHEAEVDVLLDGAHAPGMVPVSVRQLDVAYYTANLHKWVCAPKGAAFLHVREDRRQGIHPTSISHGHRFPLGDYTRYRLEFDWVGTEDPTAYLCVPAAIETMERMVLGGWPEIRRQNRQLALQARDILCEALRVPPPCPDGMIGSLAAVPLPEGSSAQPRSPLYADPLHDALWNQHGIEVPIVPWPAPPKRLVRVSAQLYNHPDEYRELADALRELLS